MYSIVHFFGYDFILKRSNWNWLNFLYVPNFSDINILVTHKQNATKIYQNPMKCQLTGLTSKCLPFFLFGLCWFRINTKGFILSVFQKIFEFICFPQFYFAFWKNWVFFLPKISYIGGTDKIKNVFSMKSLNVLYAFSSTSYTESYKFEKVMIVQAHTHDGENGWFLNFSKKSSNLV